MNTCYIVYNNADDHTWVPGVGVPFQGDIIATVIGRHEPSREELDALAQEVPA